MDERLPIKHSSGSGKEYNRAVGRSLCLWNLLLFAMYCIVTRTSDYWFPPKPRTSPYVVSAAMIVGLMLIIQGLIENTKTGGRIKQWILNFRTPHWLQQYFRTCSCSCSQSHSSSPSPPSPLPGIGGSVKEAREWWKLIEKLIEKNKETR